MLEQVTEGRGFFTAQEAGGGRADGEHESSRGRLLIASCRSGDDMAARVTEQYARHLLELGAEDEVQHLSSIDFQFSDNETGVRLEQDVSGYDVFLLQALYDPTSERRVDENFMAFLIATRSLRQWGANYITGVLPYMAYARQDKPTKFRREPTTAKLMADLMTEAGINRLVTWHAHSERLRGFYGSTPVDALESVALFARVFERFAGRDDVIAVAPDAGASKFIMYLARALNVPAAVTSKYRPEPERAEVIDIMGDFNGKRVALVLDDIISTGGTIYELVKRLVEEKGIDEVYIGVSHNLCMNSAHERLEDLREAYGLRELVVTNSIPQTQDFRKLPFVTVLDLSDTLSRVINSIHYNRSLHEPFYGDMVSRAALQGERELEIQAEVEPAEAENEVDEASEESFPASDPPSWTGSGTA